MSRPATPQSASFKTPFAPWAGRFRGYALIAGLVLLSAIAATFFALDAGLVSGATAAPAPTLTIGKYRLVAIRHARGLLFDYTYRASVTNSGTTAAVDVTATIKTAPTNVTVIDGGLSFGDVAAGASVRSRDTFTIRKRIVAPFNPNNLVWTIGQHQNLAPTAEAGPGQTVALNATAQLDGSASVDPDGDPLTYHWTLSTRPAGSAATLSDPAAVKPTFVADKSGTFVASLTVQDGALTSPPDTVTITTANSAPVAAAGADQTVRVGTTVQLDGGGSSDVDGNALTYRWELTSKPTGSTAALTGPTSVNPTFRVDKPGTYSVDLIVNDGQLASEADVVLITTENSAPVAEAGADQSVLVNTTVQLDGIGSTDIDGDALSYTWALVTKPTASQATLSELTAVKPTFTVDKPGTYVAQLIVHDPFSDSAPDTVTITTENSAPVAEAGPDQTAALDTIVSLNGAASTDADGDALTYRWSLIARPTESTAALTGPTSVNPSCRLDKAGTYIIQLIVNDGSLDSAPDTVTITTVNSGPVADAGPDQTVTAGIEVILDGRGSNDADGDNLGYRWAILSAPTGSTAALDNTTIAQPRFTPTIAGLYVVQLIVNDGKIDSDPDTVTVTVTPPVNRAPSITSSPVTTATVGASYTYDVEATDADGDTLAYTLMVAPSGMTIDSTTGLISWTPTAAGDNAVQVQVADGRGGIASQSFTVTLTEALVVVPNVVGLSRDAAVAAITAANLVLGTVTEEASDTVPAEQVIRQNPSSGTEVTRGSAVDLVVSLGDLPPDPSTVAPPVEPGVATSLSQSTEFLYTGPDPIQTGVAPGTIDPARAAVLRGRVLDKNNQPLPGVTIAVLNHPEFGQTLRRADGMFDLVVNGGGLLTVNYRKDGYLSAQRQVNALWQDYALTPDVVLIPVDSQVTTMDLTSAAPMQVARGSVQTDAGGSRQATLLFPQGTQAEMVMPDGSRQPITTLSVRATEFTVGPNGPETMPAELPPTSGYTYAVVFTADEAKAAGAKDVVDDNVVTCHSAEHPCGASALRGLRGLWPPRQSPPHRALGRLPCRPQCPPPPREAETVEVFLARVLGTDANRCPHFLLAIVVQNAGAIGPLTPVPMVLSAEVDAVQYRLIISGTNVGSTPPLVMLGGQALAVSGSTSNRVVVDLPTDLRPASYRLTISNKRDHSKADSFNVQIPAVRKDLASLPRDE